MYRIHLHWFICLSIISLACSSSRTIQSPSTVSVPDSLVQVSESVAVDEPILTLDDIVLDDSPLYMESPDFALKEALKAYESAVDAMGQDDVETAQHYIDKSLHLLVGLSDASDPRITTTRSTLQNDLARLVENEQQINVSDTPEQKGQIPHVMNSRVRQQIRWWTRYASSSFKVSYARSGQYIEFIQKELAARGMPQELQWLPVVESNFKPRAYSWADAVGMWQFVLDTGNRYGLQRSGFVDDRMDPYKSTRAALDYLNDLHDIFDDWLLAIAAYNTGENRVLRAVKRHGTKDFWKLRLPRETRQYVPRFLATLHILNNPEQYGMTLPEEQPRQIFEEVPITRSIALKDAADVLNIPMDQIKALNPDIRYGVTPPSSHQLRLPLGSGGTLLAGLDSLPDVAFTPPSETRRYRIRRGDTLSHLAIRFRTSVRKLRSLNKLRGNRIRAGQVIRVPGKKYDDRAFVAVKTSSPPKKISTSNDKRSLPPKNANSVTSAPVKLNANSKYVIRRGDTMIGIARRYGISVSAIQRANPSVSARRLLVGRTLTIPKEQTITEIFETHVVRHGDSIWSIARRYGMSVSRVLKLNGLRQNDIIKPGQVLKLAVKQGQTINFQ